MIPSLGQYPLDHVGIAVHDIEAAIAEQVKLFGFEPELRLEVPDQHIAVAFLKLENTKLEFIAPTRAESPITTFLAKRGPGLHHLCYRVPNIRAELMRLQGIGVQLIDTVPRPGAHHTEIAFLHPKSTGGVLIELCAPA